VALEPRATPIATCIDEYEWPNEKGTLPPVMMRFIEAKAECEGIGKRLCTEFEWEHACEGSDTRPYPYGWRHDPKACVNDKPYRAYSESKISHNDKAVRDAETKRLYQAEPAGSRPSCTSPYGAVDLVGNVEEWVTTSRPEWPHASSLKGGFWAKPWSGCRGTNDSHGPMFRYYEIGFRCCADPQKAP
jgi:formylglycine-generating enzyme required for sulfatase activity